MGYVLWTNSRNSISSGKSGRTKKIIRRYGRDSISNGTDSGGIQMPIGALGWLYAAYTASESQKNRQAVEDANRANMSAQERFARDGLGWRIEDAKKHGIHPLAAIGASPGPMPTIPMQAPQSNLGALLSNMITPHTNPTNIMDAEIQRETLASLRREAKSAKWDYSLLIPVTHPHAPGKTFWGFNPKYQMYGSTAQALVIAANKDEAFKLLLEQAPTSEKERLIKLKKRLKTIPKGKYEEKSNQYGTDIAP